MIPISKIWKDIMVEYGPAKDTLENRLSELNKSLRRTSGAIGESPDGATVLNDNFNSKEIQEDILLKIKDYEIAHGEFYGKLKEIKKYIDSNGTEGKFE